MQIKLTFKLVLTLFVYIIQIDAIAQRIGPNFIVIEAEDTESNLGLWKLRTPSDPLYLNPSGSMAPINDTHLEFTGNNAGSGPANSPLTYKFVCPKTGSYKLTARLYQRLEGEESDKCNDVYVRMAGNFTSGEGGVSTAQLKTNQKFFGRGINRWGSLYSLDINHVYPRPIYNLIKGEEYIFTVSGRSKRTNIDYWLFYEASLPINMGANVDLAAQNDEIYLPNTMECSTFDAVDMRFAGIEGFSDATAAAKGNLNILQVDENLAWAAAQMTFYGTSGDATFSINTLQEIGGESTYKLKVNGVLVGEVSNDIIQGTEIPDFTLKNHAINESPIRIHHGDLIQVEFNSTSNGMEASPSHGSWLSLDICSTGQVWGYGLSLSENELSILEEDSMDLNVRVILPNGVEENIKWTSLDPTIATVDNTGLIKGVKEGVVQVVVANLGTHYADTGIITVIKPGPYKGVPFVIPGRIEAEDYDLGKEGFGYHDTSAGNSGSQYRDDDVDIEVCLEGGYNVGWAKAGEWLSYTIDVKETDTYFLHARLSSTSDIGLHIEVDGVAVTNTFTNSNTGGWQNFKTFHLGDIELSEGEHVLKVAIDENDWNINWLHFYPKETVFSVEQINLSKTKVELDVGNNSFITASILPEYASDKTIKWTSKDTSIAIVDEKLGLIRAKAAGKTTIFARSNLGNITAEVSVSVNDLNLSLINTENELLKVYPNPFTNTLQVSIESLSNLDAIEIYNLYGQLVYQVSGAELNGIEAKISPSYQQIPIGMYWVKIRDGNDLICKTIIRK